MAHTPGPWTYFYKHKYDEWHVSVPISGSSMRFGIFDDGIHSENPEADARLIAAAPEMLEALELVVGSLSFDREDDASKEVMRRVDAAISKAEGRS